MSDGPPEEVGRQARRPRLRPLSVLAGTLVFLAVLLGPALGNGLPRQEICSDSVCSSSVYWPGLLPHPVVLAMAAVYGLLATALVLGLGLLWRSAGQDSLAET